jgi:hypothetical protein
MVFGRRKSEDSLATAEVIGGRPGWPTESWLKGKRLFVFSPFGQLGSKSQPVSGSVDGRVWASFRVSSKASRSVGLSTQTATWRHTGVVFPEAVSNLPVFALISRRGGWEQLGLGRTNGFGSGDAAFDEQVLVSTAPAQRQRVTTLLTEDVKAAFREVARVDQSAYVKVAGDVGWLMCWVEGEDARDAHFPPLLTSLAHLADRLKAAVG